MNNNLLLLFRNVGKQKKKLVVVAFSGAVNDTATREPDFHYHASVNLYV